LLPRAPVAGGTLTGTPLDAGAPAVELPVAALGETLYGLALAIRFRVQYSTASLAAVVVVELATDWRSRLSAPDAAPPDAAPPDAVRCHKGGEREADLGVCDS